jgi:branched-chain amino acid transport system ATP-binding protein
MSSLRSRGAHRLDVSGLTVAYGRNEAVQDVSLALGIGGCTAIVGANGAGKSSLLRCIAGLVRAKSGSIRFDSTDITHKSPWQISSLGLRLVPEGRELFVTMTVAENLEVGTMLLPAKSRRAALAAALDVFPALSQLLKRTAGQLSGGQQQMLAIARAMAGQPRMLLLDEPSLGLAPTIVSDLVSALKEIRKAGVTILISEQGVKIPSEVADEVMLIRLGRVVSSGPPHEMLAETSLRSAFFGGSLEAPEPDSDHAKPDR